jgi:hypothetical protein
MLSTGELAFMRESIEQLMPDTCDILTVTETPNGQGGITETWATAYSGVKCRLDMKTGSIPAVGGAVQQFTSYVLSLPYDTVIADVDRVEIDSVTYAVTSINDGQSWKAVKRVMLEVV